MYSYLQWCRSTQQCTIGGSSEVGEWYAMTQIRAGDQRSTALHKPGIGGLRSIGGSLWTLLLSHMHRVQFIKLQSFRDVRENVSITLEILRKCQTVVAHDKWSSLFGPCLRLFWSDVMSSPPLPLPRALNACYWLIYPNPGYMQLAPCLAIHTCVLL